MLSWSVLRGCLRDVGNGAEPRMLMVMVSCTFQRLVSVGSIAKCLKRYMATEHGQKKHNEGQLRRYHARKKCK